MNEPTVESPLPSEISKKDLLVLTGISYGQLYRWKREGLIPEEWFAKRSAFTGQETFFPRELILTRVKAIQSMKDDLSLSEIREHLARMPERLDLRKALLATTNLSEDFIDGLGISWDKINLSEVSLKALTALSKALDKAGASKETQSALLKQVIEALDLSAPVLPIIIEAATTEASTTSEEA